MERAKLKWVVLFILILLNVCLLLAVWMQNSQSDRYEGIARTQAVVYLKNHGISIDGGMIPWETDLADGIKRAEEQVITGVKLPETGIPISCEIQTQRQPETLVVDFVVGLDTLQVSCSQIRSITEGYDYKSEGSRAMLTPIWRMETDVGTFRLDCATGEVSKEGAA